MLHGSTNGGIATSPQTGTGTAATLLHVALILDVRQNVLVVYNAPESRPQESEQGFSVHELLHPDCHEHCQFSVELDEAWKKLPKAELIDWPFRDLHSGQIFELTLIKLPRNMGEPWHQGTAYALLDIKDVATSFERNARFLSSEIRTLHAEVHSLRSELEAIASYALGKDFEGVAASTSLEDVLSNFRHLLEQVEAMERRRIAADLHDGIVQSLGVLKYNLEAGIATISDLHTDIDLSLFNEAVTRCQQIVEEIRRVSMNLAPAVLSNGVLPSLIDLLAELNELVPELSVELDAAADTPIPSHLETPIYRIVQEMLNNVVRHANADKVKIHLSGNSREVLLCVTDDGSGFDLEAEGGSGLKSIRDRVQASSGKFIIRSSPRIGTRIKVKWKLT